MKTLRLNLGIKWFFFDSNSQQFRPVKNKRNFHHGDLLYKDSEFFLVHKKKKMIPISWCRVGKKIYGRLQSTGGQMRRVSKEKVIFAFGINKDEEVQTSIKPQTFPFYQEEIPPTLTSNIKGPILSEAKKRAYSLMYQVAQSQERLRIKGKYIYIKSKNGKNYKICTSTGQVYNGIQSPICVWASNIGNTPLFDQIIAKALTIAYAPKRISTLN